MNLFARQPNNDNSPHQLHPALSQVSKNAHVYLRKAISKHQLLQNQEKILIAVSGGIDSLMLVHLLYHYNQRRRKNWDILAVHINPRFDNWKTKPLIRFFETNKIKYRVEEIDIANKIKQNTQAKQLSHCYLCARARRKRLFEIAAQHRIQKIAFAHHLEDVNETYLMNLFFSSKAATFTPKQSFFQNHFWLIRPLYYFDKNMILKYSKVYGIKAINNRCPYAQENKRSRIRKFLNKFYQKYPRIKTNLFWGIMNIKNAYLP